MTLQDPLDAIAAVVAERVESARLAQQRLIDAAADLSPGAADRVAAALRHREAVLADLGRALLAAVEAGGEIVLGDPLPELPVAPPIPRGPPASPAALAALQARMSNRAADAFAPDPAPVTLQSVLRRLGPPPALTDLASMYGEIQRIHLVLQGAYDEWTGLPTQVRRDLVQLCGARARRVLDEGNLETTDTVDALFTELERYVARQLPHAQSLHYRRLPVPKVGWTITAQAHWDWLAGEAAPERPNPDRALDALRELTDDEALTEEQLCAAALKCLDAGVSGSDPRLAALLAPYVERLTHEPRLRAVRRAARAFIEAEEAEPEEEQRWAWPGATSGKLALVVGSDRGGRLVDKLSEHFAFAQVDWESGRNPRRVDTLCERIANGRFDFLILLTAYMSHKTADRVVAAAEGTETVRVVVERGYGLARIAAAVERALDS